MDGPIPPDVSRLQLALSHYRNDDLAGAELFCRDVISMGQNEAEGWFLLGMVAKKQGNLKRAEEYLEQAFKLKKNPIPKGFVE